MANESVSKQLIEDRGRELLDILQQQNAHHQSLLELIKRKREAIRQADFEIISSLCTEENRVAQAVTELEQQRLTLTARLTEDIDPEAEASLRISQIAEHMGEPLGTELREMAGQLRERLRAVQRESSVVRRAADALARHMAGIMQTVQATLTEAPVYGRRGRMAVNSRLDSAIDMKS